MSLSVIVRLSVRLSVCPPVPLCFAVRTWAVCHSAIHSIGHPLKAPGYRAPCQKYSPSASISISISCRPFPMAFANFRAYISTRASAAVEHVRTFWSKVFFSGFRFGNTLSKGAFGDFYKQW